MADINDIPWSSEVLARLKTPVTVDVGLSASDHMDALVDALNDRLGCHWGVLGSFPMANNKRAKSAIVEVAIGIHLRLGVEDNEYVQSVQREGTVEYISATGGVSIRWLETRGGWRSGGRHLCGDCALRNGHRYLPSFRELSTGKTAGVTDGHGRLCGESRF